MGPRPGYPAPQRQGLAGQLVKHLLAEIVSGTYPPGSRLPAEAVLAQRADVSRLTLREAVQDLQRKGVLRVEQGRGTFVNSVSAWSAFDPELLAARTATDDWPLLARQLTELRSLVEVGVAELAATRRTGGDLSAMDAALADMRLAFDRGDVEALTAADVAFHDAVMTAAGNPFVTALFVPLGAALRRVRQRTSRDRRMAGLALDRHTRLREAIADGSPDRARSVMTTHMRETQEHVDDLARQAESADPQG